MSDKSRLCVTCRYEEALRSHSMQWHPAPPDRDDMTQDERKRLCSLCTALTGANESTGDTEVEQESLRDTLRVIASGKYRGVSVAPGGPSIMVNKRMSRRMMMHLARAALLGANDG